MEPAVKPAAVESAAPVGLSSETELLLGRRPIRSVSANVTERPDELLTTSVALVLSPAGETGCVKVMVCAAGVALPESAIVVVEAAFRLFAATKPEPVRAPPSWGRTGS